MRTLHALLVLAAGGTAAGCGGATTGASKIQDDADSGVSPDSSASAGGSPGDAGLCASGSVSNVVRSRGVPAASDGAGSGAPAGVDAGRLPGLPIDPCGDHPMPDCAAPRMLFSCPEVHGPSGGGVVRPGDAVTVTVPVTDDALSSYACFGLADEGGLGTESVLFYAVSPGYVRLSGQVPASAAHGTVIHFNAGASGPRQPACGNDFTRLEFDVTVE